jgi:hypothetical protein
MQARSPLIQLEDIHADHPGLSPEASTLYARAAAVLLNERHSSPTRCSVRHNDSMTDVRLAWHAPTNRDVRVLANNIDRTEVAAYSVALAISGVELGHVALRRVAHGLGADWYLVPRGTQVPDDPELDLERSDLVRLEVSGIASETLAGMRRRLREKIDQVREVAIPGPAWAAVVGFGAPQVWMADSEG